MKTHRADFFIDSQDDRWIHIVDQNRGNVSVTNDAENVVAYLFEKYGDKRISYVDTEGDEDELVHRNGIFMGFKPYVKEGNK